MQLLRKISRATMVPGGATVIMEMVLADKTKVHPLYRVYGWANGSRGSKEIEDTDDRAKAEKFGPWECIIGNMEGASLLTGEISRSGQCFLPQFAVDLVVGQLGGDVERVKFGYEVGVKFDETTPTKYTYVVTSLLEPAEDDPLTSLAKALPAPKTAQITDKSSKK